MSTTTKRSAAAVLFAAALLPSALLAQEPRWARVGEVFPADVVQRIRAVVDGAATRGVPAEPILDKALEGAAKGVAPGLVLQALSEYAGRLERAGALLDGSGSRGDLVAASDALRRGVPEDAIRRIAEGPGEHAVALVVLGDLVEMGVPVDHAQRVVADALARGERGDRLLGVPGSVRRLVREGAPPAEAATRVHEAMARGGPPDLPPGSRGEGPGVRAPATPPVPPGSGPPRGRGRRPGG